MTPFVDIDGYLDSDEGLFAPDISAKLSSSVTRNNASRAVSCVSRRPPGSSYKEVITVEVGPEKKAFVIHKNLLVFYSDYFRSAFNGSFKEATEGKISLPDESDDVFEIFNQFIYSRVLADGEGEKLTGDQLIKLWLFGDKYLVPVLQNVAMNSLKTKSDKENYIPTEKIKLIWENTLPNSPLRKLILDQVVYETDVDHFIHPGTEELWTREALVDLARALFRKEKSTGKHLMPPRGRCHYHVHNKGEHC
ncbi:hypothetical protein KCU81_g6447, partial [Aureobasidium melanogenum]